MTPLAIAPSRPSADALREVPPLVEQALARLDRSDPEGARYLLHRIDWLLVEARAGLRHERQRPGPTPERP